MSNDPREQPLNDVARKIMVHSNYDPHFSGIEERVIVETALFLARYDALQGIDKVEPPVPMILFCPSCLMQHIDAEENHKSGCEFFLVRKKSACNCDRWTNPPHRSHKCHSCFYVWRPADIPTTGVDKIQTRGSKDEPAVIQREQLRNSLARLKAARRACFMSDVSGSTVITGLEIGNTSRLQAIMELDQAIQVLMKLAP